jgi:hypothetical protein
MFFHVEILSRHSPVERRQIGLFPRAIAFGLF